MQREKFCIKHGHTGNFSLLVEKKNAACEKELEGAEIKFCVHTFESRDSEIKSALYFNSLRVLLVF
jgi:hypothetical protein